MLIKPYFALWLLASTLVSGIVAVQANETSQPAIKMIEINEASLETLDRELDGIGPKKARAIVEYRGKHGPFKSLDDLKNVYGIGDKTLEKNRHKIFIRPPEQKNPPDANNSPAMDQPATEPSEESGESKAPVSEDSEKPATSSPPTDSSKNATPYLETHL